MATTMKRRLSALESKVVQRRHRAVYPSMEAAISDGADGGVIIVGDVLPPEVWDSLARQQQANLVKGILAHETVH